MYVSDCYFKRGLYIFSNNSTYMKKLFNKNSFFKVICKDRVNDI